MSSPCHKIKRHETIIVNPCRVKTKVKKCRGPVGPTGPAGTLKCFDCSTTACPSVGTVSLLFPIPPDPDNSVVIQTRGVGFIARTIPDTTVNGGNCRGAHAVDWQSVRTDPTQVASGAESVIGGGNSNTAPGRFSTVAGGSENIATGVGSTIGGGQDNTTLAGASTIAGGNDNTAGFSSTVAGGQTNNASAGISTISGGISNTTGGSAVVGGGQVNTASGTFSVIGGGSTNTANASFSTIPGGQGLVTDATVTHSFACGRFNQTGTIGGSNRFFMVGHGSSNTIRSNLFSITEDGNAHISGTVYSTGGADYAEWFETYDGSQLAPGTSVVFIPRSRKIRAALPGEIPVGVVNTRSAVVGNSSEEEWHNKYLRDDHGHIIMETVELEVRDHIVNQRQCKLNPDFDPTQVYIPRSQRPEWHIIALVGVVEILPEQPVDPRWVPVNESMTQWLIK